jgi:hypothetical protein
MSMISCEDQKMIAIHQRNAANATFVVTAVSSTILPKCVTRTTASSKASANVTVLLALSATLTISGWRTLL